MSAKRKKEKMSNTPLPWEMRESATCISVIRRDEFGFQRGVVARIPISPISARVQEGRANARLISAAPDLLEALKEARAVVNAAVFVEEPDGIPDDDQGPLDRVRSKIEAAIAKATSPSQEPS